MNEIAVVALLALSAATCGGGSMCRDWTSRVQQLTPAERAQLDEYGARAVSGRVLFSARVVPDCELRARFSRFAGSAIRGVAADPGDASAVRANGERFVAALVKVWPTRHRHFPGSDGAFRDELSSLLVTPDLEPPALRPLIAKILRDDGVSGEVAYALLTRPDPFFAPELRRGRSGPRPVQEELLALAVLQRMGEDTRPRLLALGRREDLTPAAKNLIRTLLSRSGTDQPPRWDDLIDVASESPLPGSGGSSKGDVQ